MHYVSCVLAGYLFGVNDAVASWEEYSRRLVDSVMSRAQAICNKFNTNVNFLFSLLNFSSKICVIKITWLSDFFDN